MDKDKNLDNFLESKVVDEFYDCCYKIIKNAYLEGYNFGKNETENNKKDNVIKLPKT